MYIAVPDTTHDPARPARDSYGGFAYLPPDTPWPAHDGAPMVLFLQFDVRPEFGLTVAPGSHVAVFMSATYNDIPALDMPAEPLPPDGWSDPSAHLRAFCFPPSQPLAPSPEPDSYLVHQPLKFEPGTEDERWSHLVVGGEPEWLQDPAVPEGFGFLCQLPEDFPFPKRPEAPEQPDSFSRTDYCLFLGNSVLLFARPTPQNVQEVWITVQN